MLAASRGETQAAPGAPRAGSPQAATDSAAPSRSAGAARAEPRAQTSLERWLARAPAPEPAPPTASVADRPDASGPHPPEPMLRVGDWWHAEPAPPAAPAIHAPVSGPAQPAAPAAPVAARPALNPAPLTTSAAADPAASGAPPGRVAAEASVSPEVRRLLFAQRHSHGRILGGLRACAPSEYRKRDHWAWWVFPTSKVGMCDPRGTAVRSAAEARWLLDAGDSATWAAVLDGLASALFSRANRDALPRIDHDRVNYFVREWTAPGHVDAAKGHPEFAQALERFSAAWDETRAPPSAHAPMWGWGGADENHGVESAQAPPAGPSGAPAEMVD